MRNLLPSLLLLAAVPLALSQEDTAGRFFDDRMAEFNAYLKARENMVDNAQERKALESERLRYNRRMETARKGYTGLTPSEQKFWDELRAELNAVLNLWLKSAEAEEGEKQMTRTAAMMALEAAQKSYEAQMRFAMAQLGMAACSLDADTIKESTELFRAELQREYKQDFQAVIYAVPWGLEQEEVNDAAPEDAAPTHGSGEAEEGNVDISGGEDDALLDAPAVPLMVQELAHEVTHNEAARADSARRATSLWRNYLNLCAQQVEYCFGSERGASLVSGVPLPGAVEMSHFAAVQERSKRLFLEAEQAWTSYVNAVVSAYDPGWQASEGAMAHTPIAAEALLMSFSLYSTHEQYLAFILSPHLQYVEPEPLPDTGIVE